MAQPLYFLPDLRAGELSSVPLARRTLTARGLLEVFADVPLEAEHLAINELRGRGPGNRAGTIICYQAATTDRLRNVNFEPDSQRWTAIGDGSLVWIGTENVEPPTEQELRRQNLYGGYLVHLANGESFQIPTVRRDGGGSSLPTDLTWDAAGKLIEPLKPAYQTYWDDSAEVASWFFGDAAEGTEFGGQTFSKARALELAIKVLSLNYRYGRGEHEALRLIDGTNYLTILGASVDLPRVRERLSAGQSQKKTAGTPAGTPAGSTTNSTRGSPGG